MVAEQEQKQGVGAVLGAFDQLDTERPQQLGIDPRDFAALLFPISGVSLAPGNTLVKQG